MPRRGATQARGWSLCQSLHDSVSVLLEPYDLPFEFYDVDDDHTSMRQRDTNVMGMFICDNRACSSQSWTSKMIAITIRMYPNERYNAKVYHQRCRKCKKIGRPVLDESYAARVAYRLKKWSGVEVEVPFYSGESKGPHERSLCEGCRSGHCSQGDWS